jgi:hypothetical protein
MITLPLVHVALACPDDKDQMMSMFDRGMLNLGALSLVLLISGCTQLPLELPSPTHTS